MKYLIMMYPNAAVMDALSEEDRNAVFQGHGEFMTKIKESGEFVGTVALGGPEESSVVRVRGGVPAVTDGPYAEFKEMLAGFQTVVVDSEARALEIAARVSAVPGPGGVPLQQPIHVRRVMEAADFDRLMAGE